MRPGERLPAERALAEEFGVSRPSVREAIQKLVARGLLLSRHGGGTFVSAELGSSFRDPLLALLENNPEAQRDLSSSAIPWKGPAPTTPRSARPRPTASA